MDKEPIRIRVDEGTTPNQLISQLQEMFSEENADADAPIERIDILPSEDIPANCPNSMPKAEPMVSNIFEHAELCEYTDGITQEEIINDNTAMTDVNQRGVVDYFPSHLDDALPNMVRDNIYIERRNNTDIANALLEIDRAAIEAKANIDMKANRLKYETMLEYNTQCGIHRQSVVMCRIVEDLGKKKR